MNTAWMFPGQGSQHIGMGREAYEGSAVARATFEEASDTLGFDIAQLCFEGPDEQLTATEFAQPAILTVSIALMRTYQEVEGLRPILVAGHSLGEYSALVAAGSLTFADAVRLVRRRGELMAVERDGTMAAIIGMDLEPLEALCQALDPQLGPCVVANQNAPGQLVISGTIEAVHAVGAAAKAAGAKRVMPLNVSAAFHSPLLAATAEALAQDIAATAIAPAQIPVVANTTAELLSDPAAIKHELTQQVTAPVRWIDTIQRFVHHEVAGVVELGPGSVLTGLVKRIAPTLQRITINTIAHLV